MMQGFSSKVQSWSAEIRLSGWRRAGVLHNTRPHGVLGPARVLPQIGIKLGLASQAFMHKLGLFQRASSWPGIAYRALSFLCQS